MQPIETTRAHCVDPETLAAWVDGGLAAPAAEAVEAHLSTCARCQAVLAALSATEIVLPFWSRRRVQWAAAALAAAASITLWTMNRPEPAPMPTVVPDSVIVQAPPAPPTPPTPLARQTSPRTSPPAPPTQPPSRTSPPRPTSPVPMPSPVVTTPPPPSPPPPPAPATPPPPPPPAAAPPPVNPRMATTAARQEQRALSASAEVAAPRPAFEVISVSDQNEPLAIDGLVPIGAGRGGGGGGRGAAGNVAGGFMRRPLARWRVSATVVERSLDSGQTWERLDVDPPFTVTAGSAPFQNVCWLVGHDGVVFRTTNGTSFERMTPPDKVDLLAIVASDRLRAMVTAVDGRIFDTTDGGATWTIRK